MEVFFIARNKQSGIYFKISDQERDLIAQKMALTNIRNRSAYIKKMCIDGYVINLDTPTLTEIGRLLRITAGNVNQIAKRVNWGGNAYREDVAEVISQLADIREMFGQVLRSLAKIK